MGRAEQFDRLIIDGLDGYTVEQWLREAFRAGREFDERGYGVSAEDEYINQFFGGPDDDNL